MPTGETTSILKQDALGRVERLDDERGGATLVRRVACGGSIPGSAWVARRLLARERRALAALTGLPGVPALAEGARGDRAHGGARMDDTVLVRTWVAGDALHEARVLPRDFFDNLDRLVAQVHARGVCHNDLHKEQNVIVGADGFPALVDFQLASVHRRRSRLFASRVRDDLRHVEKHRRRYTREGRAPEELAGSRGTGAGIARSWTARWWRRTIKPLYNLLTRGVLRTRDGEARRASSGPWPEWSAPRGPRTSTAGPRVSAPDGSRASVPGEPRTNAPGPRVSGPNAARVSAPDAPRASASSASASNGPRVSPPGGPRASAPQRE